MFVRHADPVSLTQAGLEGLCVSLNRPVVDLESLPPGPARAAIALHRAADGERGLFVALRSVESGAVVYFVFGGKLTSRHKAIEEGLSFAERMGFLFDDDMLQSTSGSAGVEQSAARRALECWCELVGDEMPLEEPLEAPLELEPLAAEDEILEVGDVEPLELLDDGAGDGEPEFDDMVDLFDPEFEQQVPLSKFRPEPGAPDPLEESATLGRVAIVRRRVAEEGPADFPTRLLASF